MTYAVRSRLDLREEWQMGRECTEPELFVLGTGQNDNIGDVVLRREYFDRLRAVGRLQVYMGAASSDFLDGLHLHEADVVHSSFRQWYAAGWSALLRGRSAWFVDKPGELSLDQQTFSRQVKLLPLIIGIRLRRGQVLRLGLAMRAAESKYLTSLRGLFRLSTLVRWRDTSTTSAFHLGAVEPDWAFGWNKTGPDALDLDRTDIVVTYRGDRDLPSDAILDELRALARDGARRIVVVTQVRRDARRSDDLASRLDAELVPWPPERSLADHEDALRAIYRRSALVVSDRLHALIVGMTEGAVPLCITDRGEPKVARHLDAVGFYGSTVMVNESSTPLGEVVGRQITRRAESLAATRNALDRLDDLTAQLKTRASARRAGGLVH
jgi:hypothetical protein